VKYVTLVSKEIKGTLSQAFEAGVNNLQVVVECEAKI